LQGCKPLFLEGFSKKPPTQFKEGERQNQPMRNFAKPVNLQEKNQDKKSMAQQFSLFPFSKRKRTYQTLK
jgi:hypothetical protein